jgi:hypothetical protein
VAWQNLTEDIEEMFSILPVPYYRDTGEGALIDSMRTYVCRSAATHAPREGERSPLEQEKVRREDRHLRERGKSRGRPPGSGKNELRARALEMVAAGTPKAHVARALGVSSWALQNWCKAARPSPSNSYATEEIRDDG